jgi:Ca-activated chloride channel family protein
MTVDRGNLKVLTMAVALAAVAGLFASVDVRAEENPDELYRQGRFEEAEKIYGRLDMDRPRDLRYRFNRGCAAFQKGDDEAAMAAFASVLRRTKDEEMRFRAAFNLGNIAFRHEEYETAADWYRRAVLLRPGSEDARHNLELALRESERKKEEEKERETPPPGSEEGKEEGEDGMPSPEDAGGEEKSGAPSEDPGGDPSGEKRGEEEPDQGGEGREGEVEQRPSGPSDERQDLAGELSQAGEELPAGERSEDREGAVPLIDRKKAEALLDNIREDRSRFLRFQVPQDRERGAGSGKDW